jgi:hypothetical protein
MILPRFLVVGGQKCGTTWLSKMLESHPEICMPKGCKETLFFAEFYHKGIDWYARYFEHCGSGQIPGEVCPLYMIPRCFNRILDSLGPDVKIMFMVRNPVDAFLSKYYHELRDGSTSRLDNINDFVESLGHSDKYLHSFLYFKSICRFKKEFSQPPRVWFYDDITSHPKNLLRSVYEYLGVDEEYCPQDIINTRYNPSGQARFRSLNKLLANANFFLKGKRIDSFRQWIVKSGVKRLIYKPLKDPVKLNIQSRTKLIKFFHRDITGLSEYTGRDLSHWLES